MKKNAKTWILTISLTILIATQITAQNSKVDFFTEIPQGKTLLKDQQKLKLGKLERNKRIKSISIVNVKKLIDHQKGGFLPFRLPGIQDVLVAKANSVDIKSNEEFTWSGLFEDRAGQVILISDKDGLYGHISFDNVIFELYTLGDGYHALAELDTKQFTNEECGTLDKPIDNGDKDKGKGIDDKSGRWTNCALPVRVLVLFTANAQAAVTNINQTATLAITQTNTAFTNSAIFSNTVQVSMAGLIQINFDDRATGNIATDVNTLAGRADVQTLRNDNGADFVVLLTDGNYGGAIGIVREIGPNNAFAYAVVQATGATGTFSFAHELGHLFGGRHQQCNIFLNGGCDDTAGFAHGFAFGSNNTSIMHQLSSRTRILNYSNPNVAVSGSATGIAATNHNTRQITEQMPTVAAFRQFVGALTASAIVRKSAPSPGTEQYRCEAVATCGQSPISFEWRVSSDGFGYGGVLSVSEFYTINIPECSYYYVWLRIYSADNQAANYYFTIGTPPGGYCQIARRAEISALFESEKQDETIRIYPNPAQSEINAQFFISSPEAVSVELLDIRGTKLINSTEEFELGWHTKKIPTETFASGIYILSVQKKSSSTIRKVIISK
ncbi:MAG: zinc-dependent metalloprotease [Flammeovirgaceae bacterium]